ncbi:hypothetical protein EYF80_060882 [Liparis tanakae]|uniref:Uncharacterized protein n=1 Tax=Liparis tanakae TaxID=230148 RepID=A0A4Z2EK73_9TELE|nr:hypothetical protein EYF80_060882 [Liparis tanakae]
MKLYSCGNNSSGRQPNVPIPQPELPLPSRCGPETSHRDDTASSRLAVSGNMLGTSCVPAPVRSVNHLSGKGDTREKTCEFKVVNRKAAGGKVLFVIVSGRGALQEVDREFSVGTSALQPVCTHTLTPS